MSCLKLCYAPFKAYPRALAHYLTTKPVLSLLLASRTLTREQTSGEPRCEPGSPGTPPAHSLRNVASDDAHNAYVTRLHHMKPIKVSIDDGSEPGVSANAFVSLESLTPRLTITKRVASSVKRSICPVRGKRAGRVRLPVRCKERRSGQLVWLAGERSRVSAFICVVANRYNACKGAVLNGTVAETVCRRLLFYVQVEGRKLSRLGSKSDARMSKGASSASTAC